NGGFRLLTRGPRLDRRGRRPHMGGQALLRPRLYIGVLRVHDGALRSTRTQRYRVCHPVGRVIYRSGPFAGPYGRLDAAFPLVAPRALLAAPCQPLYIHLRRRGKPPHRDIEKTAMLNEVYNTRILELAGNIPRLGRLPAPDATATAHSKLCGSTGTLDPKTKADQSTE